MTNSMEKEREDRRKVQESQKDKEQEMHQDIIGLLRQKNTNAADSG